jgi:hypothetical protein
VCHLRHKRPLTQSAAAIIAAGIRAAYLPKLSDEMPSPPRPTHNTSRRTPMVIQFMVQADRLSHQSITFTVLELRFQRRDDGLGARMGFLQRTALNVAVALPLIGVVGCAYYAITEHVLKTQPRNDSSSLTTNAAPRTIKQGAVIETERVRPPSEIAAEAYSRALALRDANAGPVPSKSSPALIQKPRPKKFSSPLTLR